VPRFRALWLGGALSWYGDFLTLPALVIICYDLGGELAVGLPLCLSNGSGANSASVLEGDSATAGTGGGDLWPSTWWRAALAGLTIVGAEGHLLLVVLVATAAARSASALYDPGRRRLVASPASALVGGGWKQPSFRGVRDCSRCGPGPRSCSFVIAHPNHDAHSHRRHHFLIFCRAHPADRTAARPNGAHVPTHTSPSCGRFNGVFSFSYSNRRRGSFAIPSCARCGTSKCDPGLLRTSGQICVPRGYQPGRSHVRKWSESRRCWRARSPSGFHAPAVPASSTSDTSILSSRP